MSDSERPPTTAAGKLKRAVLVVVLVAVWAFLLWGFYRFAGVEHTRRGPGSWLGIVITLGVALAGASLWRQLFPMDLAQPGPARRSAPAVNGRRRWSAQDDRTALELHREGLPNRAIATRLGRTTTAVRTRIKVLQAADTGVDDSDRPERPGDAKGELAAPG